MPEYEATKLQFPQTQSDPFKMLNTLSQLQLSQAHAGLYGLQAQQQARELSGWNILQQTGDPSRAIIGGLPAATGKTYQDVEYNRLQQSQLGGWRAGDVENLARAKDFQSQGILRQMDIFGRIGTMMSSAKTPTDRDGVIDAARDAGIPISPLQRQAFRDMSQSEWDDWSYRLRRGGMPAQESEKLDPSAIARRQAAEARGAKAGGLGMEPPPPIRVPPAAGVPGQVALPSPTAPMAANRPPVPSTSRVVGDDEAVRQGLYEPTPEQTARGVVPATANQQVAQRFPPLVSPPAAGEAPRAVPTLPSQTPIPGGIDYTQPGWPERIAANQAAVKAGTTADFERTGKFYGAAQSLLTRVPIIAHNIETLGPAWMGAGSEAKATFARRWNGLVDTVSAMTGNDPRTATALRFDPTKVATTEEFYKEQIRAGMELINANFGGQREAATVIDMGRNAVAGLGNTYLGAKYVLATIEAAARRQADVHAFKLADQGQGGDLATAELRFDQQFPPQMYAYQAIAKVLPPKAVNTLLENPKTADRFDEVFHMPGLADYVLRTGKVSVKSRTTGATSGQ